MKEYFNAQTKQFINEIKERIEKLKLLGMNEQDIKNILFLSPTQLSPLLISREYQIFLPEYNHVEIQMYPLPKAVFFLFLNHPEGIPFKQLVDYKDELFNIYMKVSNRSHIEDMNKSIDAVINSGKNSINELCSRIKEAFVKKMDESVARNYFITGNKAAPKKITLDRGLIILEKPY